jgi:hypothetical protein
MFSLVSMMMFSSVLAVLLPVAYTVLMVVFGYKHVKLENAWNVDTDSILAYVKSCVVLNTSNVYTPRGLFPIGWVLCKHPKFGWAVFNIVQIEITVNRGIQYLFSLYAQDPFIQDALLTTTRIRVADRDRMLGATFPMCKTITPYSWQTDFERIVGRMMSDGNSRIVMICGKPGIGKSTVGVYFAKSFGWSVQFLPVQALNRLINMLTNEKYVFVIDEIDVALKKLNTTEMKENQQSGTYIATKADFNRILDTSQFATNTLTIFTTNMMYSELSDMLKAEKCESVIRPGRINAIFEVRDDKLITVQA